MCAKSLQSCLTLCDPRASLVAQLIKNPPEMQETLVQFLGREDTWRSDRLPTPSIHGLPWWLRFFILVKSLPAVWETWVRSLDQKNTLEKGTETHSSFLAWSIPRDRGAWWTTAHGVSKESDTTERLSTDRNLPGSCVHGIL